MQIRWNRILGLGFFVVILSLAIAYREAVWNALSLIERIGPGNPPDQQFKGALILGLLLVSLVAITRILTSDSRPASGNGSTGRNP